MPVSDRPSAALERRDLALVRTLQVQRRPALDREALPAPGVGTGHCRRVGSVVSHRSRRADRHARVSGPNNPSTPAAALLSVNVSLFGLSRMHQVQVVSDSLARTEVVQRGLRNVSRILAKKKGRCRPFVQR